MSIETRLKKMEAQNPPVQSYEARLAALIAGRSPGPDPVYEAKLRELMEAEAGKRKEQ
jgi:hypothetical protein